MSHGCAMVRCPHCAYEFVESGKFTDMLLRWIRRGPPPVAPKGSLIPITALPLGSSAAIAYITPTSAARLNRLASYGIIPGSEVRLLATRPSVVLSCGSSSLAMEEDVGREIFVMAQ
jgi:Fe2+ transport system protein FeoA